MRAESFEQSEGFHEGIRYESPSLSDLLSRLPRRPRFHVRGFCLGRTRRTQSCRNCLLSPSMLRVRGDVALRDGMISDEDS